MAPTATTYLAPGTAAVVTRQNPTGGTRRWYGYVHRHAPMTLSSTPMDYVVLTTPDKSRENLAIDPFFETEIEAVSAPAYPHRLGESRREWGVSCDVCAAVQHVTWPTEELAATAARLHSLGHPPSDWAMVQEEEVADGSPPCEPYGDDEVRYPEWTERDPHTGEIPE